MKIGKQILFLSLIAFALHIVWENAQAPLYSGYLSFSQHFLPCLFGTVGDVVITLCVYGVVALLKNEPYWITALRGKDIIALAGIGFFIAVGIEWQAMIEWQVLFFNKWEYDTAMTIIPYLEVGLTPILQMTILLPLSLYLTKKLTISYRK